MALLNLPPARYPILGNPAPSLIDDFADYLAGLIQRVEEHSALIEAQRWWLKHYEELYDSLPLGGVLGGAERKAAAQSHENTRLLILKMDAEISPDRRRALAFHRFQLWPIPGCERIN